MTEQQLTEQIQKLWIQATASCGSATPQLVEEIRILERQLEELRLAGDASSPQTS